MKFAHRSSHDGVRYLPHHAVKMWQKNSRRGHGSKVFGTGLCKSPSFLLLWHIQCWTLAVSRAAHLTTGRDACLTMAANIGKKSCRRRGSRVLGAAVRKSPIFLAKLWQWHVHCWTLAFSRIAHLTTAAKLSKKIYIHIESLENRWRSGPQVAQLFFCCTKTIKARALLNFGYLRHCSYQGGGAPGQ